MRDYFIVKHKKSNSGKTPQLSILNLTLANKDPLIDIYSEINSRNHISCFLNGACNKNESEIIDLYRSGKNLNEEIKGEYSLAIVDGQKLIFARDHIGTNPLFYYEDEFYFILSNKIKYFQNFNSIILNFNYEKALEYLAGYFLNKHSTLYNEIKRARINAISIHDKFLSYTEDSLIKSTEKSLTFTDILNNEIKYRTKGRKFDAELSGGLDSSSIVALSNPKRTHSIIFESKECCETKYINSMVEMHNIESKLYDYKKLNISDYTKIAEKTKYFPDFPNSIQSIQYLEVINNSLLLTGYGGDHLLCNWKYNKKYKVFEKLKSYFLNNLKLRKIINKRHLPHLTLNSECSYLKNLVKSEFDYKSNYNSIQNGILQQYTSANTYEYLESSSLLASEYNITKSHPLLGVEIFNFCVNLTEEELQDKTILRESLGKLLPEEIKTRKDKADFSVLYKDILYSKDAIIVLKDGINTFKTFLNHKYMTKLIVKLENNEKITNKELFIIWNIVGLETLKSSLQ